MVSLDNPNIATLLGACAAAGIGTAGLPKPKIPKAPKKSVGEGGRKSPGAETKKAGATGGANAAPGMPKGAASGPTARAAVPAPAVAAAGGDKKTPAAGGASANGDAGSKRPVKAEEKPIAPKSEAGKGTPKSPKTSGGAGTAKSPGGTPSGGTTRTPTKCLGKPGLALPPTLFPELARSIDDGG